MLQDVELMIAAMRLSLMCASTAALACRTQLVPVTSKQLWTSARRGVKTYQGPTHNTLGQP